RRLHPHHPRCDGEHVRARRLAPARRPSARGHPRRLNAEEVIATHPEPRDHQTFSTILCAAAETSSAGSKRISAAPCAARSRRTARLPGATPRAAFDCTAAAWGWTNCPG